MIITKQDVQQTNQSVMQVNGSLKQINNLFTKIDHSFAHKVLQIAKSWIGTPFHPQGRTKAVGCDCIGFIIEIAYELSLSGYSNNIIKKYDRFDYDYINDSFLIKNFLQSYFIHIDLEPIKGKSALNIGSIVLFQLSKTMHHLAIISKCSENLISDEYIEDLNYTKHLDQKNQIEHKIIHSCSSKAEICEITLPFTWYKRIVGVWQFPQFILSR